MGGPGPTQRSSSGGGATGSVEEGTVHGNTLATVSASFSRSVQLPEVESQALDGDRSGRGGHESRRNTRTSPGREGRGSVRHHREQTNSAQHVPLPQRLQIFPRRGTSGPPIGGWKEFILAPPRANQPHPTCQTPATSPIFFPAAILGPPIGEWRELVSAGGRGEARLQPRRFLTGHHRRHGAR